MVNVRLFINWTFGRHYDMVFFDGCSASELRTRLMVLS